MLLLLRDLNCWIRFNLVHPQTIPFLLVETNQERKPHKSVNLFLDNSNWKNVLLYKNCVFHDPSFGITQNKLNESFIWQCFSFSFPNNEGTHCIMVIQQAFIEHLPHAKLCTQNYRESKENEIQYLLLRKVQYSKGIHIYRNNYNTY